MTIWPDSDPISFLFFFLFIQGSKEGVKFNENEAKGKENWILFSGESETKWFYCITN